MNSLGEKTINQNFILFSPSQINLKYSLESAREEFGELSLTSIPNTSYWNKVSNPIFANGILTRTCYN